MDICILMRFCNLGNKIIISTHSDTLAKSDVGERVRNYRVLNCYTQTDFAEKIGISVNFLSEIENGKKGMSQETLYRLCEYFGLSADYILFGKDANHTPAEGQVLKDTELKTLTDFLVSMRGVFSSGPS